MSDGRKIEGAVDSISNLPDVILQHILCFTPTKESVSTSLLSRRWRHVWSEVPSISLPYITQTAASVTETLTRYTALKTKSFHLTITPYTENISYIDRLIKFAMSHNVENLSLAFCTPYCEYKLPDFFYKTSSVKQLNIYYHTIIPFKCTVSWTSLQKLSLTICSLSDESMAKILSGCPILENLTLYDCSELCVLDLSKSLRLRTLDVNLSMSANGPTQIVAPHIHYLILYDPHLSCTLVDVASLTEAKPEIFFFDHHFKPDFLQLQVKVLEMLDKLQNAEKLTLGRKFIQILSLAEIRGVQFPILKVKSLTLGSEISQYVIPGIERLLQNSPDLEKLTVRGRARLHMQLEFLDNYLKLQGLDVTKCWRSKDGASWNEDCVYAKLEHVASVVELMLKNCTEKLDKMVVLLNEGYRKFKTEDLTATLSHNKNVTIVLSCT